MGGLLQVSARGASLVFSGLRATWLRMSALVSRALNRVKIGASQKAKDAIKHVMEMDKSALALKTGEAMLLVAAGIDVMKGGRHVFNLDREEALKVVKMAEDVVAAILEDNNLLDYEKADLIADVETVWGFAALKTSASEAADWLNEASRRLSIPPSSVLYLLEIIANFTGANAKFEAGYEALEILNKKY